MHDALAVEVPDRLQKLEHKAPRDRLLEPPRVERPSEKIATRHELKHNEQLLLCVENVDDRDDARVLERFEDLDLLEESLRFGVQQLKVALVDALHGKALTRVACYASVDLGECALSQEPAVVQIVALVELAALGTNDLAVHVLDAMRGFFARKKRHVCPGGQRGRERFLDPHVVHVSAVRRTVFDERCPVGPTKNAVHA
eukprot:Amastigsp_a509351_102.p2 type:complete len:200 gc:universal Amastigsp_a509351_102:835-236(-)